MFNTKHHDPKFCEKAESYDGSSATKTASLILLWLAELHMAGAE